MPSPDSSDLISPGSFAHGFPRPGGRLGGPGMAILVLTVALAWACLVPGPAWAASQQQEFKDALHEFKALLDSPSKAKYRDNWLRVHDLFQDVHNIDSTSVYAAKSLYYMARVYQELGERSYLASDHRRAADAFQRAVNRFAPGHSWVDDCLYRKADILAGHLGDGDGAARTLRRLLRDYPKGDFAPRARTLLASLEGGGQAAKAEPAPKPAAKPAAKPASKPPAKASASLRNDYQRAVSHFRSMRASGKTYTRENWLHAYKRFSAVYTADPVGEYAPRALYFMGYVYDELGRRSGSDADFQRAVGYYERAARLFPQDSTWIDDALLRKAEVSYERLGDEDQAYADLLQITRNYPGGDQYDKAKDMLRAMDQARVKDLPAPEPSPAAAPEPEPERADAVPAQPTPSGMATLTDVRQRSTSDYTRIVLDLEGRAGYQDHLLPPDPAHSKSHRMYIDVDGARVGPAVRPDIKVTDGFLRSVRVGQYDPDTARVVLDFEKPQKYHVFTLENPYRIVVDVFAEGGQEEVALVSPGTPQAQPKKDDGPPQPPSKATQQAAKDILSQLGMTVRTILIDPGHGGRDPGAVRRETVKGKRRIVAMEKDITLRAAKVLGAELKARGFNVLYTRTDDTKVSLEDRSVLGNIKKADMFVSLHCNANNSASVSGFETYYLSKASNKKVLRLAAYENGVDPVRISDTQKIVMDLVHGFKIEESRSLAAHVQKRCVQSLRKRYSKVNDHGSRGAPFFVLIGAKMPAILVEIGYISNATEAKRLESDKYLQTVADGIADGIEAYRKELIVAGM